MELWRRLLREQQMSICDESEATGVPSGSTRTERSEGEGWSRAREKRPPERNQRLRRKSEDRNEFRSCPRLSVHKWTFSVPS